jgi:hypothetical protein
LRGSIASKLAIEKSAEMPSTIASSQTNSSTGSGSLLPMRSTLPSMRSRRVGAVADMFLFS